jgi:hypothetical protein
MAMRSSVARSIVVTALLLAGSGCRQANHRETATPSESVRNGAGMRLMVAAENTQPTLRVVLPGRPTSDRSFEILFPEHATVRPRGRAEGGQLYMFQPGQSGEGPLWRRSERALEYEKDLPGALHMLARATLEEDGVHFHFRFSNRSDTVRW